MYKMDMEKAKTRLRYDPQTGDFFWLDGPRAGLIAGCTFSNGYRNLTIDGKMVGAHRVAWYFVYGYMPKQIDHINGNPADNRLVNLRESTQSQNKQNSRTKRGTKSGLKGICYSKDHKKWRAMIGPRGAVRHLGYFKTPEEAHAAYVLAANAAYGEFSRAA